jgi:cytochrome oxidase Cu insertion factor (SCO1/SenC/PrrC family)/peroxiredoxin
VAAVLVLTGLAYLFTFALPARPSGTVLIEVASAGGDRLAPTTVTVGTRTLRVAGAAPRAPSVNQVGRLTLAPGTYQLSVGGVAQPRAVTIANNQVQPILLAVSGGRVVPGGVYAGAENLNLGLSELGGDKLPVARFNLTDQDGKAFTRDSLLGRDTVVAAFHTTCRQTCPLYTGLMFELRKNAPEARLVEVTTDPVTDTPAALAAYRERIGADWTFATGSLEAITEFWAPFGVQASTGDSHTSALVLVDAHGYIRAGYVGVPDVGGKLPGPLAAQLDAAGRQLLASHGEGWGAPQVLQSLRTLVGAGSEPTGGHAPEFRLPALTGDTVSLEEFRGRTVILNFWWSGCPPCRAEMPMLQRFADRHPDAALLLVDSSDSPQAAQAFARSVGVTAPILMDSDGATMASYHVAYFPTTIVVGPDGVERFSHAGPVDEAVLSLQVSSLSGR